MDKKQKSNESEFFPIVKTRTAKVAVVDYDSGNDSSLRAEVAPFQSVLLRDFLHVVFKRKLTILLAIIVVALAVAIEIFNITPAYRASAKFLVHVDRRSIYDSVSDVIRPAGDRQINSEIEILKSRSLAEKTIEAVGVEIVYPEPITEDEGIWSSFTKKYENFIQNIKDGIKRLIKKIIPDKQTASKLSSGETNDAVVGVLPEFRNALQISSIEESNLIMVKFTHEDPQIAATVVNTLADIYLDHHLTVHKTPHFGIFIQRQTQVLGDKLQKSEDRLKSLKEQHNIFSLGEERSLLLNAEAGLRKEMNANYSKKIESEKKIQLLKKQLTSIPNTIQRGENVSQNQSLISTLETKLIELEIKESEINSKYSVRMRDPFLKKIEEEKKVIRRKLKEFEKKQVKSQQSGENPTHRRLKEELLHYQAELKALRAKYTVQKIQLSDYKHKLEKLNEVEVDFAQLQQQIDLNRQSYLLYMNKFEESRISEAMDAQKIASVVLVEPAHPPLYPTDTGNSLRKLLFGVFIGAFGGLGLALCREYLSDKLEKVDDVEECLQLPVLASIPELKTKS